MSVNETGNKGLRTPTLHRLHRPPASYGMTGLPHCAIAALSTREGPCARARGQIDVLKKRSFGPATAGAATIGHVAGVPRPV
jgi:hypothetical protein